MTHPADKCLAPNTFDFWSNQAWITIIQFGNNGWASSSLRNSVAVGKLAGEGWLHLLTSIEHEFWCVVFLGHDFVLGCHIVVVNRRGRGPVVWIISLKEPANFTDA